MHSFIARLSALPFVGAFALLAIAACGGAAPPPATAATSGAEVKGSVDAKIRESLAGAQRTEKEQKRDEFRHPLETLEFFGLKDDMTVVEISPGEGWYSAVLAPVLRDHGKLVVAGGDPNGDPKSEGTKHAQALLDRFQKMPQSFDKVQSVVLKKDQPWVFGPPESADMVLTFRNFHNWVEAGTTDKVLAAAFKVLKHGGVLGLTDHRANAGRPDGSEDRRRHRLYPGGHGREGRGGGRLQARRQVGGEREPQGHEGLPEGGLDAPADLRAGRHRPRKVRGDRRERPDDAQVRQALERLTSAMLPTSRVSRATSSAMGREPRARGLRADGISKSAKSKPGATVQPQSA